MAPRPAAGIAVAQAIALDVAILVALQVAVVEVVAVDLAVVDAGGIAAVELSALDVTGRDLAVEHAVATAPAAA